MFGLSVYIWVLLVIGFLLIITGLILIIFRGGKKSKEETIGKGRKLDIVYEGQSSLAESENTGRDTLVHSDSSDKISEAPRQTVEEKSRIPSDRGISFQGFVSPAHGASSGMGDAGTDMPVERWSASRCQLDKNNIIDRNTDNEAVEGRSFPLTEPVHGINLDAKEQLLLLKSHELLLTLSDGLRKLSVAKTDAVRKEKIAEMQAALALLDVKSEWDEYKSCFEKVYPGFWPKVESLANEEMTPYELRLCALLSLGMGTKEIADLTNRSVRTVETSIYKIRKKLSMESDVKTQDFLKGLL